MFYKNKYEIDIQPEEYHQNIQRLTNQLWKLIPMRENEEDWKRQIVTVLLEIVGMNELFTTISYIPLISKLEALQIKDEIDFDIYRKTVFECIDLLRKSELHGK